MTRKSKEQNGAENKKKNDGGKAENIAEKLTGAMMFPMLALTMLIALFFDPSTGAFFL